MEVDVKCLSLQSDKDGRYYRLNYEEINKYIKYSRNTGRDLIFAIYQRIDNKPREDSLQMIKLSEINLNLFNEYNGKKIIRIPIESLHKGFSLFYQCAKNKIHHHLAESHSNDSNINLAFEKQNTPEIVSINTDTTDTAGTIGTTGTTGTTGTIGTIGTIGTTETTETSDSSKNIKSVTKKNWKLSSGIAYVFSNMMSVLKSPTVLTLMMICIFIATMWRVDGYLLAWKLGNSALMIDVVLGFMIFIMVIKSSEYGFIIPLLCVVVSGVTLSKTNLYIEYGILPISYYLIFMLIGVVCCFNYGIKKLNRLSIDCIREIKE